MSQDQLFIGLTREEDKRIWQAAEQAAAKELGESRDNLSRAEIARELAEAYRGGDACGGWREE